MTLKTGTIPEDTDARPAWGDFASPIEDAATLGQGLRAARLRSGRSLAELSVDTRVHTRYLIALEEDNFSALPSRVFALGYARAYAAALNLDEQLAVERFKRESPDGTVPLQAPTGIAFEDVRRHSPVVIAAVVAIFVAVIAWNVFQRISLMKAPQPSDIATVPQSWATASTGDMEIVDVDAPRPAPADQTTPAAYITPGLEAQLAGIDPTDTEAVAALSGATPAPPVQAAFNPRGAIYGAPANASQVTIQARKAGALVVRFGDGRVLFARQLAAGEAWRAPKEISATLDVSDPAVFDVYLNGEYAGGLAAKESPLGTLNARAAQGVARQAATPTARPATAPAVPPR